jgi:hypothetical protein
MGMGTQVVFIDHTQLELEDNGAWREQHQSKVNQHEVDMVIATVRYLYQQGYGPERMVVLTPYLGQLMELQRGLSNEWNVIVDGAYSSWHGLTGTPI